MHLLGLPHGGIPSTALIYPTRRIGIYVTSHFRNMAVFWGGPLLSATIFEEYGPTTHPDQPECQVCIRTV
jgi:hypothetical protein